MKRLLIIGASLLQLPAIRLAKAMGLHVAVADYNPEALGIPYADQYYNASTIDIEAICRVAEVYRPDGIVTLATDMPMRSIAAATQRLGLPGISLDTAIRSTDKGAMIRAFEQAGVPIPWYRVVDSPEQLDAASFSYPCVVKPADNSGSRGVTLVSAPEDMPEAYRYSRSQSRGGGVIVEEYLRGQEVSVEAIIFNGEVTIVQTTDKLTTGAPNFVEMGHSQPSRFTGDDLQAIHRLAADAIRAVGIDNGSAHVELMVTPEGPRMIELGARLGGDCITTHLVPLSTGVDMVRATIDIALGSTPQLTPTRHQGSAIRYFDVPCGRIRAIRGVDEAQRIPGVVEIMFTKAVGDEVTPVHSSLDRVGMVLAQGATVDEAVRACEAALTTVQFDIS